MTTPPVAWQLEHAVDANASLAFVWVWRTDITTWDDPPARFELEGPFVIGAEGKTILPGQAPLRWALRDVRPNESFLIEMPLDQAAVLFEWRFEAIDDRRTRLTQRIGVGGENAASYADQVRTGFGATLVDGMARLARAIEDAARSRT